MVDLQRLFMETGDIPWIVGLSGGKDSTALTMHLLRTIESLPPPVRSRKRVFVTCVNTLVEAPPVIAHVHLFIRRLRDYVRNQELPVEVVELTPETNQTFWVNLIGRGYPAPNRTFRWCTDRMKVRPAQKFIEENVEIFGDPAVVHFLLGTRFDESTSRQNTMDAHTRLSALEVHSHGTMSHAGVIRPIENWTTEDVWDFLLDPNWIGGSKNPFYEINQTLAVLYKDAASGECPVIHDASRQTCAGSRFGCWTCTVVEVDSSLQEMIETGGDRYDSIRLQMLADFRNDLQRERNIPENRVSGFSRTGRKLVKRDGTAGVGSYTMEYRKDLLTRLLEMEEKFGEQLISDDEKDEIARIWVEEKANLTIVNEARLRGER